MHRLIISPYSPPDNSPQSIVVGNLLHSFRDSENITLITQFNYRERQFIKPIVITRKNKSRLLIFIDFFEGYLTFIIRALRIIFKNDFEEIITLGQPNIIHLIALFHKKKHVIYMSDPWSDNPYRKRLFFFKILDEILEKIIIRKVAVIIVTNENVRNLIIKKNPKENKEKFKVLHHPVKINHPKVYSRIENTNNEVVLSHVGAIYGHRKISSFLIHLNNLLIQFPKYNFTVKLIGPIINDELKILTKINREPNFKIKLLGKVDHKTAINELINSTAAILVEDQKYGNLFLPSKLFEYIGYNKVIIGHNLGENSLKILESYEGFMDDISLKTINQLIKIKENGHVDYLTSFLNCYNPPTFDEILNETN